MLWNYMQLKINLNKFHVNVFLVVIMHILYLLNASKIRRLFILYLQIIYCHPGRTRRIKSNLELKFVTEFCLNFNPTVNV